jgi:hypothetical protein
VGSRENRCANDEDLHRVHTLRRVFDIAAIVRVHETVIFVCIGDGRAMLPVFAFYGGLVATFFRFRLLLFLPLEFFLSLLKGRCHSFARMLIVSIARERESPVCLVSQMRGYSRKLMDFVSEAAANKAFGSEWFADFPV